jgi:hypothetical protein
VHRGGLAIIFGPGNMKQTGPWTANYTILPLPLPKINALFCINFKICLISKLVKSTITLL